MSLAVFRQRLQQASFGENDRNWFPKWLARYAEGKALTNSLFAGHSDAGH